MRDLADHLVAEAQTLFALLPQDELTDSEPLFFRTTPEGHLVVGRRVGDVQDEYTLVGFDQPEGLAVMATRRWVEPEGRAPNVVARLFRDGEATHEAVIPFVKAEELGRALP
jgi:hypothetical protein